MNPQPGALTQGTRHRRDKGIDPEHRELAEDRGLHALSDATREGMSGGVVGARSRRTKVKRREASVLGEPAGRGEARSASEARAYGRRGVREVCCC